MLALTHTFTAALRCCSLVLRHGPPVPRSGALPRYRLMLFCPPTASLPPVVCCGSAANRPTRASAFVDYAVAKW